MSKIKWWEKTVEYKFVKVSLETKVLDLLMPLDGNVEAIGDAIVGEDSNYYIIEFKKSLSNLKTEYDKYENGEDGYRKACREMLNNNSAKSHYLIGGKLEKTQFSLEFRRYFINTNDENELTLKHMFESGMTQDELNEYSQILTRLKKGKEESTGSTGISYENASVLAVKSNKKATLIPLDYYLANKPKNELKNTNKNNNQNTNKNKKITKIKRK